jgi:hypothetical protein
VDFLHAVHVVREEHGALVLHVEREFRVGIPRGSPPAAERRADGQLVHHVRVEPGEVGDDKLVREESLDDLPVIEPDSLNSRDATTSNPIS